MHKLDKDEPWDRVRQLKGRTVYTTKQKRLNFIENVTETAIIIKNRKSRPKRTEITDAYETLWKTGELRIGRGDTRLFTYFISAAILQAAVPEQIESINTKLDRGFSGILLKKGLDC